MYKLIEQLADKIARKYFLDKDAILNQNPNVMYMDLGEGLLEIDKRTHLSKCITKEKETILVFNAIQTLLSYIH